MRKLVIVPCFTILAFYLSILVFSQFATSSIDPGDAATIIGNMTSNNIKQSQQPINSSQSSGTNGSSIFNNNTHQINQTVRMAVNNT
jgi:hypothetical protein